MQWLISKHTRKCTRTLYCPQCTGEHLCAQHIKFFGSSAFLGTAPLISEPLIWASPRQMKVTYEIWILIVPIWESQEKEFPAESGRRSSVVLTPTRRAQSHQFPKGPAFNSDFSGVGDMG
eukprot:bmy_14183T0